MLFLSLYKMHPFLCISSVHFLYGRSSKSQGRPGHRNRSDVTPCYDSCPFLNTRIRIEDGRRFFFPLGSTHSAAAFGGVDREVKEFTGSLIEKGHPQRKHGLTWRIKSKIQLLDFCRLTGRLFKCKILHLLFSRLLEDVGDETCQQQSNAFHVDVESQIGFCSVPTSNRHSQHGLGFKARKV